MPRNFLKNDEHNFDRAALLAYFEKDSTNIDKRMKMRGILNRALQEELTENQRFCILEYYIHGRKMKDIAKTLSVNPSTVTRHIKRAKARLQHIAKYY